MVNAIGVEDFVRTATEHGADLAGTTDLACVIRGMVELSDRQSHRLAENGWTDLARELDRHSEAYAPLVEHLSGVRPAGLDLVILQSRLVQPLWQDAKTPEPVIQLAKSVPVLDEALIRLVGDDAHSVDAVRGLRSAGERLSAAAEMFAPDFDPTASDRMDPELRKLLERLADPYDGPADKPGGPKL